MYILTSMFHHNAVVIRQSKLKIQDCEVEDIEIGGVCLVINLLLPKVCLP